MDEILPGWELPDPSSPTFSEGPLFFLLRRRRTGGGDAIALAKALIPVEGRQSETIC
jgi:hypothetical protein